MDTLLFLAADLVAISALVFGLFMPRHHRRELIVAFLVVNIGVFTVANTLNAAATIGAGVGLGLFGVLSIIRLRSNELSQTDIAYYFSALAIGLLTGLGHAVPAWTYGFLALILVAVFVGDHPRMRGGSEHTTILLDRAYPDHVAARANVERLLGGNVQHVEVEKIDLVNDTTLVRVRHTPPRAATQTVSAATVAPAAATAQESL